MLDPAEFRLQLQRQAAKQSLSRGGSLFQVQSNQAARLSASQAGGREGSREQDVCL